MNRPLHGGDADTVRGHLWALLALDAEAGSGQVETVAAQLREQDPAMLLAAGIDATAQLLTALADHRNLGPGCFAGAMTAHPSLWGSLTPTGRVMLASARDLLVAQARLCPACAGKEPADGDLEGSLVFARGRIHREAQGMLTRLTGSKHHPAAAALDVLARLAPSRYRSWAAAFTAAE